MSARFFDMVLIKYMHFVPFTNGCAPPVLDKDAI